MQDIDSNSYFIYEGVSRLGYSVTPQEVSQLLVYLEVLRQWNTKMNLTAIRDEREIIVRHFLDSLAGLAVLPGKDSSAAPCKVMDIGTGAGFPGLPLKICRPKVHLTLLEPRQKKAAFLHAVCGQLGLQGVSILPERLEALAQQPKHQGGYDILTSRALKVSGLMSELASSLLRANGQLVLWTAQGDGHLLHEHKSPSVWDRPRIIPYRLPFDDMERSLVVFQKAG
jgi:16S rRNA (guanine527-N7)-methyltransferase